MAVEADAPPEADRLDGHAHPRETRRLFGQERAEGDFLDAWRGGRLHHAWLLRGPAGVGKATLAYRIARALIAAPPEDGGPALFASTQPSVPETLDPPEGCPVMARIRSGGEAALTVLRRQPSDTGKSLRTVIRVEDVRDAKRFLSLSSPDGRWRVVLVDTANEMNSAAANALLKMLEEPPVRTMLLLVSNMPAGLLPTIRSRCRTLDLAPLESDDLARALAQAGAEIAPEDRDAVRILAGGSVGAALRLVDGGGIELYDRLLEGLKAGAGVDRAIMLEIAQSASGRGAEDRFALTLGLLATLTGRLASAAARGGNAAATRAEETRLFQTVARHPAQALPWAEASERIARGAAHALAVNLDAGRTIIDMFLDLDATLTAARRLG